MKDLPKIILWTLVILLAYQIKPYAQGTPARAIESALKRLLDTGLPEHKIGACPGCPGALDVAGRVALASGIQIAAHEYDLSPGLLGAIAYREGAFAGRAVGKLGEISTFQIIPDRAKAFDCGDIDSHASAARCAAKIITAGRIRCGDLEGALAWYATGRTCTADTKRLKWLVEDRLGIAKMLDLWITEAK